MNALALVPSWWLAVLMAGSLLAAVLFWRGEQILTWLAGWFYGAQHGEKLDPVPVWPPPGDDRIGSMVLASEQALSPGEAWRVAGWAGSPGEWDVPEPGPWVDRLIADLYDPPERRSWEGKPNHRQRPDPYPDELDEGVCDECETLCTIERPCLCCYVDQTDFQASPALGQSWPEDGPGSPASGGEEAISPGPGSEPSGVTGPAPAPEPAGPAADLRAQDTDTALYLLGLADECARFRQELAARLVTA